MPTKQRFELLSLVRKGLGRFKMRNGVTIDLAVGRIACRLLFRLF